VVNRFNGWCSDRGIEAVTEVTADVLKSYRQHLFHHRNQVTGRKLKFSTQHAYLIVVRRWFHWLHEQKKTPTDLAANLEIPKPEHRLPVDVLTADEVESMMNATNVNRPIGIRDRAILETFYSTGIRNSELLNLQLYDVDDDRQVVIVRQGKGRKDRVVPIGQRALKWIKKYVADVRPTLVQDSHSILFVNANGNQFVRGHLSVIVKTASRKRASRSLAAVTC
jgi:integrase/recombinase XerD